MLCVFRFILLSILVSTTIAAIFNGSFLNELDKDDKDTNIKKRLNRRIFKIRSTSSSSREKAIDTNSKSETAKDSLGLSESAADSKKDSKEKKDIPKSSEERRGWKKWHRKCQQCPEMKLKWRDPSIKWICAGYQRARRSFKSLCMMHFRNCQDGTMFTKIAEHRCPNSSAISPHGEHFFYDYKVFVSDIDGSSDTSKSSETVESVLESIESWDTDRIEEIEKQLAKEKEARARMRNH